MYFISHDTHVQYIYKYFFFGFEGGFSLDFF